MTAIKCHQQESSSALFNSRGLPRVSVFLTSGQIWISKKHGFSSAATVNHCVMMPSYTSCAWHANLLLLSSPAMVEWRGNKTLIEQTTFDLVPIAPTRWLPRPPCAWPGDAWGNTRWVLSSATVCGDSPQLEQWQYYLGEWNGERQCGLYPYCNTWQPQGVLLGPQYVMPWKWPQNLLCHILLSIVHWLCVAS